MARKPSVDESVANANNRLWYRLRWIHRTALGRLAREHAQAAPIWSDIFEAPGNGVLQLPTPAPDSPDRGILDPAGTAFEKTLHPNF